MGLTSSFEMQIEKGLGMGLKSGFGKQIQQGFESQSCNLFQQNMSPIVGNWSSRATRAVMVSW